MNLFTPEKLIFRAIKSKLEGTGIIKIVLVFNVKTDKYNIMLSKEDNTSMKLEIEENEISMLKKMFISKIEKKFAETSKKEIQSVILQMNIVEDELKVFIQDNNNEVEQFVS
jgi:hypothetical protein